MKTRLLLLTVAALLLSINLHAQPSGGGPGGGNLALALQAYSGVESVDFETIWGQGHTEAEDSGSASSNFISWVKECATAYTAGIRSLTPSPSPKGEGSEYLYDLQGRRVVPPTHSAEGRLFPKGLKKGIYIHRPADGRLQDKNGKYYIK